jgi:hypothetical protein
MPSFTTFSYFASLVIRVLGPERVHHACIIGNGGFAEEQHLGRGRRCLGIGGRRSVGSHLASEFAGLRPRLAGALSCIRSRDLDPPTSFARRYGIRSLRSEELHRHPAPSAAGTEGHVSL